MNIKHPKPKKYFRINNVQKSRLLKKLKEIDSKRTKQMFFETMKSDSWRKFSRSFGLAENTLYNLFYNKKNRNIKDTYFSTAIFESFFEKILPEENDNYKNRNSTAYGDFVPKDNLPTLSNNLDKFYDQLTNRLFWLYSFGEKTVNNGNHPDHGHKRVYYIKKRPVLVICNPSNNNTISIKNNDQLDSDKNIYKYEGRFELIQRKAYIKNSDDETLNLYMQTNKMNGNSERNLQFTFCFGTEIKDIALGMFTGINDNGSVFSGACLLQKTDVIINENTSRNFDNYACKFITNFTNENSKNELPVAIRKLLDKRGRSYLKLPRDISEYTLDGLDKSLTEFRNKERESYEERSVHIHRFQAFVSSPLRYNDIKAKDNLNFLLKFNEILIKKTSFTKTTLGSGLKENNQPINAKLLTSVKKFDVNFTLINQSNFFILVIPNIEMPSVESNIKISSVFLELGYAMGLRKRIICIIDPAMDAILPDSTNDFNKNGFILKIYCNFESDEILSQRQINEIDDFFNKYKDY